MPPYFILKFMADYSSKNITRAGDDGMQYGSDIMAGGAAVSSGLMGFSNQINQSNENEKARKFNSEEAQKSRDYNTWLLQNETRLKAMDTRAAGLNPAFMNGSLMSSNPSPTSPAAASPSGTIPFDVIAPYSNMMLLSQARNLDANAKKNEAEANKTNTENMWLPMLLQQKVDINDGEIHLIGEKVHLTKEEARNVSQSTENLKAELNRINEYILQIRQQTSNLKQDEVYKKIQNFWASPQFEAQVKNLMSSTAYNYAQAKYLLTTLPLQCLNLSAQANLAEHNAKLADATGWKNEKEGEVLRVTGDKLSFHLNLDKKYSEIERVVDIGHKLVDAVSSSIKSIVPILLAM